MKFLTSVFVHESISPGPLNVPLGPFRILMQFAEIFAILCLSPVSMTPAISCSPVALGTIYFFPLRFG
jgi:hypothetical protein